MFPTKRKSRWTKTQSVLNTLFHIRHDIAMPGTGIKRKSKIHWHHFKDISQPSHSSAHPSVPSIWSSIYLFTFKYLLALPIVQAQMLDVGTISIIGPCFHKDYSGKIEKKTISQTIVRTGVLHVWVWADRLPKRGSVAASLREWYLTMQLLKLQFCPSLIAALRQGPVV